MIATIHNQKIILLIFKLLNLEYANLKLAINDKHFIIGEKKIEYIISDENIQLIKLPIVIEQTL